MGSSPYTTLDESSGINTVIGQPQSAEAAPLVAPPGAPTVGMWKEERYCGLITWLVALFGGLPCSYFCPCDRRTVWISGGVKHGECQYLKGLQCKVTSKPFHRRITRCWHPTSQYNEKGAVTDDYLFLNPCPKGSIFHPDPTT